MIMRRARRRPSRLWWLVIAPVAIIVSAIGVLEVSGVNYFIR